LVNEWQPRAALEATLLEVEQLRARHPDDAELQFFYGNLLWEIGRAEEAKRSYCAILERIPTHFGALTRLGMALREEGRFSEARATFEAALEHHPENAVAHVNLANIIVLADAGAARAHYETALRLQPDLAEAHQGFSSFLALVGDREGARRHRDIGFKGRSVVTRRYRGDQAPIPVLLLRSTTGGNVDVSMFIDDRKFLVFELFADAHDPDRKLPPHKLVFNGIGDPDRAEEALAASEILLQRSKAPVLNPPRAVLGTGRLANATRFASVPGVIAPKMAILPRSAVAEHGFAYPFLLRTPGHHLGQNFLEVESEAQLADVVQKLPGEELCLIDLLDARGPDGKFRKYRVMMIGGTLYPAHLAIADHWKVHYFSADMSQESNRREEERFLTNMPGVLGERAMQALAHIQAMLGLDYAGIDFGLNARGEILFFEANAAMTLYAPPSEEQWAYRIGSAQAMLEAARQMTSGQL
jgi:hypothetical protein